MAEKKINLIYGALLLHSAGKPIDETHMKKISEASGAKVDDVQIKALVAALEGVNIEDAINKAAVVPAIAAPAAAPTTEKKEEKSEEDMSKKAEEAAEGLSSLFG